MSTNDKLVPNEMTLRDYFATNAPTDSVQELTYRCLSQLAQEALTGLKYPEEVKYGSAPEAHVAYQIEKLKFLCAVDAAIRFQMADAMLKARGNQP